MSETLANGAPATAPQTAPAVGQSAPVTTTQSQPPPYDVSDYQRLKAEEDKFKNGQRFYNTARQYGFDSEDALKAWAPLAKQKIDPTKIAALFGESGAGDANSASDAVAMTRDQLQRELTTSEERAVRKFYERQHEESLSAERGELSDERIKKELEGLPDEYQAIARHAVTGMYMSARKAYGDDHPLKGQYGPAGKDGIGGIFTTLKDSYKAIETKLKAGQMVAIGQAANKQPANTVAGSGAGSGKPEPTNTSRPGGKPSREDVEAEHARRRAARGAA